MRSLQQYIIENQIHEEYLLTEGVITNWLKKFWKWMIGDMKKKTDKNGGRYVVNFDEDKEIKVAEFEHDEINGVLKYTKSLDKKGVFYKLTEFIKDNKEIAKKLSYFGFLQDQQAIMIIGGENGKDTFTVYIECVNDSQIKQEKLIKKHCYEEFKKHTKKKFEFNNKYKGIIKEELDVDNLDWKMETWFSKDEHQKEMFNKIYADNEQLDNELLNGFDMQGFVNFIYDDVNPNSDKDYKYQFEQIVKYLKQK